MQRIKFISLLIISSSLLLSGCSKNKIEPSRPEVKSNQTVAENYSHSIEVANQKLMVEVVNSNASRAQGLSYRSELKDGNGMLFDFTNTKTTKPSFWMKDMNFDIDIIWIANGKIIGAAKHVPAPRNNSHLPTYSPPSDITHVLEVPSGWVEKNKIQIGDEVKL